MRKIAIFVEGQTELITVREFLRRKFCYNVSIECRKLFTKEKLGKVPYDFPNPNAQLHFQIIDVGNDNAVLSRILKREKQMRAAGYEKIIGLRDMYSRAYRDVSSGIDDSVIKRFIEESRVTVQKNLNPRKR